MPFGLLLGDSVDHASNKSLVGFVIKLFLKYMVPSALCDYPYRSKNKCNTIFFLYNFNQNGLIRISIKFNLLKLYFFPIHLNDLASPPPGYFLLHRLLIDLYSVLRLLSSSNNNNWNSIGVQRRPIRDY